jgi:hypothetical protein
MQPAHFLSAVETRYRKDLSSVFFRGLALGFIAGAIFGTSCLIITGAFK